MENKPLILFDMDGTLLDTRKDIARAANNARRELHLPVMTVEDVVRAVGDGVNLFVSRVTFPESHPRFLEAKKVFLKHYAENIIGETKPYEGIPEVLFGLSEQGFPLGVVSNKPFQLVDQLIQHFAWEKYFKVWLGGDSSEKPKPDRSSLDLARKKCSLPSDYPIVMVGDGNQDILAAKAVEGRAIWCAWGFNTNPTDAYSFVSIQAPLELLKKI